MEPDSELKHSLGWYSPLFDKFSFLPAIFSLSCGPLGLYLDYNTSRIPQTYTDQLRYCIGICHSCAKQACTALFRQMAKNPRQRLLESKIKQPDSIY